MADMLFCPSLKAVNLLTSSGTVTCSSSQMESRVCMNLILSVLLRVWVLSSYWFQLSCPLGLLPWVKLVDNFEAQYSYITNEGTVFTFHSNLEAPRYRLINIDIQKPERQHWTTIIPQHDKDVMGENTRTFYLKNIKDISSVDHNIIPVIDKIVFIHLKSSRWQEGCRRCDNQTLDIHKLPTHGFTVPQLSSCKTQIMTILYTKVSIQPRWPGSCVSVTGVFRQRKLKLGSQGLFFHYYDSLEWKEQVLDTD